MLHLALDAVIPETSELQPFDGEIKHISDEKRECTIANGDGRSETVTWSWERVNRWKPKGSKPKINLQVPYTCPENMMIIVKVGDMVIRANKDHIHDGIRDNVILDNQTEIRPTKRGEEQQVIAELILCQLDESGEYQFILLDEHELPYDQ